MAAVYVFITSAQSGALGALMLLFTARVVSNLRNNQHVRGGSTRSRTTAGRPDHVGSSRADLPGLGLALLAGSLSEAGRRVALAESELPQKGEMMRPCRSSQCSFSPRWPAAGRRSKTAAAMPIAGRQLVTKYGCDTCHVIPGVKGTQGMVGPSLQHIASRQIIASKFRTPQTMMRWIQNPQSFDPQTSMPNMNVTPADARDITAYLFTLK